MRKGTYILVAAVLLVSLVLAACAQPAPSPAPATPTATPKTATPTVTPKASPTQPAAATPRYGGMLRIAFGTMPRSFLPPLYPGGTMVYPAATHDSLLRLDDKGELAPWLATSWKVDQSAKTLTLTLRKGVKFHDGTDFTAAAVKWNIEKRRDSKQGDYEEVTSISIIDDYTLVLNLSKFTNTLFVTLWNLGGYMASQTAFQKMGEDWAHWNPVGTGPFKFVNYVTDSLYKLERFDGYWQKGKPYLDKLDIHLIADKVITQLALEKGEVDAFTQPTGEQGYDLQKKGFQILQPHMPDTVYGFIADSANPDSVFANKKVREAVEYAIDREAIVKAVGYGFYEPSYQITPTYQYPYNPEVKGRPYNPAKAKQLLAEAGYPNGFKTSIYGRSTSIAGRQETVAAVTNLKEVGIDATLVPLTITAFAQRTQEGWKNSMLYQIFWSEPDWVWRQYANFSTTSVAHKSMLKPSGLQDLLEKASATPDFQTQKTLSQQIVKMVSDEAIVAPLWAFNFPVMYVKQLQNPGGLRNTRPTISQGPADFWLNK
ncbi:MAG: ABC transporter substrate-binding protein [Chloroflexi bacterium]|nr:ABC transporter substrate-binding protein [Chloroflexota bacterium]